MNSFTRASVAVLALAAGQAFGDKHAEVCPSHLKFISMAGDSTAAAIEDDIRADLAAVGITVEATFYETRDEFNTAMTSGDFDLCFSETWGAPYDPHSYLTSWTAEDEAHYALMSNPEMPLDAATFATDVAAIMAETDETARQTKYAALLGQIHDEVLHLPLYGRRIPAVVNKARITGYAPGYQQFEYPIHKASVVGDGSTTVTVSPGAQAGLFTTVGRLDPHSYRPNEFFANNWVYEGLTQYGADGAIEPALAESWTIAVADDGTETITFTLRTGVTFHDGEAFDCAAVKLNFDHVFAEPLRTPDWHGWYGLPGALASWECAGEAFVITANAPYYPLLQELTYIRPLRMLSPAAFVGTDPYTHNSCPTGWESATLGDITVTCVGTTAISGTGPWKFESRTERTDADGENVGDAEVVFAANTDYWGGAPTIEKLVIKYYESAEAVNAALIAGDIDMVVGAGVLAPADLTALESNADFEVTHSAPLTNQVVIMNVPDKKVREAIVHAVDKQAIIDNELAGEEAVVHQLFPTDAPYCDQGLVQLEHDPFKAWGLVHDGECPAQEASDDTTEAPGPGDDTTEAPGPGDGNDDAGEAPGDGDDDSAFVVAASAVTALAGVALAL